MSIRQEIKEINKRLDKLEGKEPTEEPIEEEEELEEDEPIEEEQPKKRKTINKK